LKINQETDQVPTAQVLERRERTIYGYIKNHPGTTKMEVVRGNGEFSKVPTLKAIDNLLIADIIVERIDLVNKQVRHLFINEKNTIMSYLDDLENSTKLLLKLLDTLKEKLNFLEVQRAQIPEDDIDHHRKYRIMEGEIISEAFSAYKYLSNAIGFSFLFRFSSEIKDKQALSQLYIGSYEKLGEVQVKLFDIVAAVSSWTDENVFSLVAREQGFDIRNLVGLRASVFYYRGVGKNEKKVTVLKGKAAEPFIDSIWKLCGDLIYHDQSNANKKLPNWRNIKRIK
jgi:hypothetical protein